MPAFFSAWHYDGQSAIQRIVDVEIIGRTICLYETEQRHGPFSVDDLIYIGDQGPKNDPVHIYGLDGVDGWRLGLSGPVSADIAAIFPARRRYGKWVDRLGLGRATVAFAVASAAVVGIILLTPHWLAPLIPSGFEQKMGNALIGDFGGRFCDTDKGQAALQKMVRAIAPDAKDLQVEVAKIDIVNAVALPGGNIILFDGLVKNAKSPDEVVGVLAHEIGHVHNRHVMQALLRQLGLSLVLGGLDGNGAGLLNGALSMSYSRNAESEADAFSISSLAQANISPTATADFFKRLSRDKNAKVSDKEASSLTGYLSSHPSPSGRKKAFEDSLVNGRNYQPVLSNAEWQELKSMCTKDKDAKSGFGFDF